MEHSEAFAVREMLSDKELKLLEVIRKMDSGEVRIEIEDGEPVAVEEIIRGIEL